MPLPFQDDQIGELAEETTAQSEKVEAERQEERGVDMEETVTTQVMGGGHCVVLMKHSMTVCCSCLFI